MSSPATAARPSLEAQRGDPAAPRLPAVSFGRAGALPWTLLSIASGLMVVSAGDALARTGHSGGTLLFWLAIVLIVALPTARLAGHGAGFSERLATVAAVGLGLYGVKVLRDPFAFDYGDELLHLPNLHAILTTGRLFGSNTILPISPRYPGLETATALIVRVGGLSSFDAGLLLIAIARLIMMVALYLFYERVSGSPRIASLGVLVYTATPTFLFFGAQFAYESLALPLGTVALLALIRWARAGDLAERRRWAAVVILIALAVIVTHHVSSYFLVLFLLSLCLVHIALHERRTAPWVLAVAVTMLTVAWLTFVAGRTVGYLSPVLTSALRNVIATINRETPTRTLFANQSGQEQTDLPERVVALLGIAVLAAGILAGLTLAWRRRWRHPMLVQLVVCTFLYMATLLARFVPAAWETASRAGEFLFIGVGLTVALGANRLIERSRWRRLRPRWLIACGVTLMFASGAIGGWPGSELLAQTRRVAVDGRTLDPPQVQTAIWSGRLLGPSQRVFAQDTDALFVVNYSHQFGLQGAGALNARHLGAFTIGALRNNRISLVEADRRKVSSDLLAGFFFDVGPVPRSSAAAANKFDTPKTDVVFDSQQIAIYGVRRLW